MDGWELAPSDEAYPSMLKDLGGKAPVIMGLGDPTLMHGPCLSIIGARRSTPYGEAAAEMAGRVAAECGIVVVSGGAMGCDHAASRAALDAGGKTVIVSGVGADMVYPASSRDIFEEAASRGGGAVISMEPWGKGATKGAFPRRNYVIAAREMERAIFCVPGSIFSPNSSGTNRLIADGATIICDECDLELAISLHYNVPRLIQEGERRDMGGVVSALVAQPMRPQELAERLNQDLLVIFRVLADYEAKGLVVRLADGRYAASKKTLHSRGRIDVADLV